MLLKGDPGGTYIRQYIGSSLVQTYSGQAIARPNEDSIANPVNEQIHLNFESKCKLFFPALHLKMSFAACWSFWCCVYCIHYSDVIMATTASQITSLTIVYSTFYSRRKSKKTSKLGVTELCEGNSPVTGEFPSQRASNTENVSSWWRHHIHDKVPGLVFIQNVSVSSDENTKFRSMGRHY